MFVVMLIVVMNITCFVIINHCTCRLIQIKIRQYLNRIFANCKSPFKYCLILICVNLASAENRMLFILMVDQLENSKSDCHLDAMMIVNEAWLIQSVFIADWSKEFTRQSLNQCNPINKHYVYMFDALVEHLYYKIIVDVTAF